jgi:hypothetical protein
MEGSAPKGASTSIDADKIQNADLNNPLTAVPTGGSNDPSSGAATSQAPINAEAPQVERHPVESALMAEMQDTRKEVRSLAAQNRLMAMALFCVGLACIYYLTVKLKAKLPMAPEDIVTSASHAVI